MGSQGFHEFVIDHPLTRVYRRTGVSVPMRLSDVASLRQAQPTFDEMGMSSVLTVPLVVTPRHICVVALMRSGRDFARQDLDLARQLQPVLGGVYALRDRGAGHRLRPHHDPDLDVPLTTRELAVLDLMADGLIAKAIATKLGISHRTVVKHIENIYRKLDTHDRTSAVLRGQAEGHLPSPAH
jgi:DNA-binding CsgD family transcriptional regulator